MEGAWNQRLDMASFPPGSPVAKGPLKAPYPGHPDNIPRIKSTYYTVPTAKWQLASRFMPASMLKERGKRGSLLTQKNEPGRVQRLNLPSQSQATITDKNNRFSSVHSPSASSRRDIYTCPQKTLLPSASPTAVQTFPVQG